MTQAHSHIKVSPAVGLFGYSLKKTLGLTVLLSLFAVLICPGYLLIMIQRDLENTKDAVFRFGETATAVSIGTTVLSSMAVMLYLFINFAFLYSDKGSDFFHALPIRRRGLLFSRFFASVLPPLLPVCLVYGSMLGMLSLPTISGSRGLVLMGLLYNVAVIFLCAAFTLIFLICAGNVMDFLISFATYHIGIVFINLILADLCEHFLRGFLAEGRSAYLYRFNPVFYSIYLAGRDLGRANETAKCFVSTGLGNVLVMAIIALLISAVLYRYRKSEKSGHGYAYRFLYRFCMLVTSVCGAFLIGTVFSDTHFNAVFWIFAAIGGILAAVAYGAINDRGFKTVKYSVLTGCVAWVLIAALVASLSVDLVRFTSRMPRAEQISEASVQFAGAEIRFKNPAAVLALHQKAIPEPKKDDDRLYTVQLHYALKNGGVMDRSFEVNVDECEQELLTIYHSEEYTRRLWEIADSFEPGGMSLYGYTTRTEQGEFENEDLFGGNSVWIADGELQAILQAYCEEAGKLSLQALTRENVTVLEIDGATKQAIYERLTLFVEPGFTKTRAVLDGLHLAERVEQPEK